MISVPILLIDDHAMFRSGMRLVLNAGIEAADITEASSLEEVARVCDEAPAVVLLDVGLRGVNGVEGLSVLKQRWPQTPVIMLSSTNDAATVRLTLARGAAAFVSKAETASTIVKVIEKALGGQLPQPGDGADAQSLPPPLLTPRQCEVLDLLAEGLSNKVIARRLNLSEFTVRGHVQSVLGALGVTSRAQATFAARERGLIGN